MLNNMKTKRLLCLAVFIAGLLSPLAWAASQPRISADEAAARVQQEYGGRILAVETQQQNGKTFYRIKVLTGKGVVRVVRIKAGSRQ